MCWLQKASETVCAVAGCQAAGHLIWPECQHPAMRAPNDAETAPLSYDLSGSCCGPAFLYIEAKATASADEERGKFSELGFHCEISAAI